MRARDGGDPDLPDEFSLIEKLFAPLAGPGAFGLKDDAAVMQASVGCDLVLTKDAIAEGRHFLPGDPAGDVARKLLRVNLSDLAAKGARPTGYLLACAWNRTTSLEWMAAFAEALHQDQKHYGLMLLGGDTIRVEGPSVFSLTAIGEVPSGKMVRRAGAQPGDGLYVTGTIGDAALGLKVALGEDVGLMEEAKTALLGRYRVPNPPVGFGAQLSKFASSALDVSDGLLGDLQHLCDASGEQGVIERDLIPLSAEVTQLVRDRSELWASVLAGGDDYQILFSVSPESAVVLNKVAAETNTHVTRIGQIIDGQGVGLLGASGERLDVVESGFSHF